MLRKTFISTVAVICVMLSSLIYADSSVFQLNDQTDTISVLYASDTYEDLKIVIKKGDIQYVYNLFDGNETFPLQMGSGEYSIGLYKRTEGNKYRALTTTSVSANVDTLTVFKASVQNINWSIDSASVKYALKLANQKKSDREKFVAIHKFMIDSIVYDYQKAATVGSRYIPVIDLTFKDKKGICYDYSSLMASMLRSLEIPAKLAEGKSTYTSVYHAWNEVYLDGKWITVDSTIDAQLAARKLKWQHEKSNSDYVVAKVF